MSVRALLNIVIATLAGTVVVVLSLGVWESWNRLAAVNQIALITDASRYFYSTLPNLRFDRNSTVRDLNAAQTFTAIDPLIKEARDVEMAGLKSALTVLQAAEFPGKAEAIGSLADGIKSLSALHQETATALLQPKAARRQDLPQEYMKATTAVLEMVDRVSSHITNSVKLQDAYIDQLLTLKQLAWRARNAGGDASVMVSATLGGQPLPPDALLKFTAHVAKLEAAWQVLEDQALGLPLPPSFAIATEKVRRDLMGREFSELRLNALKGLIATGKSEYTSQAWTQVATSKLASLLGVADVALEAARAHAADQRANALLRLWVQFGLLLGAVTLSAVMIWVVSRRVIAPLQLIQQTMRKVATGDFSIDMQALHRKDEVGQIAVAVDEMAHHVRLAIREIKTSGHGMTNASAEISTSTTDLSQRTEEQAASLEETSTAMAELAATVTKNSENAQQASTSASGTRDVADRGGQVVAKAVEAMAKIEESSRKISDIIGLIDEIARQTNLLALNAAVEAARAGEAGRGFAIVATEVRSLAQRSTQAAKDIKDLITTSNSQVKEGVDLVNRAGASLSEIVDSIKSVATIVAGIANASVEQSTGIHEINKALTQMDKSTQQNSALVEENAATAKTLELQAKAMDDQVAFFQIGDGQDVHPETVRQSRAPSKARAPAQRRPARAA